MLELEAEPSYNYGLLNKKGFLAELYRHTESAKVFHELQQLAAADLLEQLVQTRAAVQGLRQEHVRGTVSTAGGAARRRR